MKKTLAMTEFRCNLIYTLVCANMLTMYVHNDWVIHLLVFVLEYLIVELSRRSVTIYVASFVRTYVC